MEDPLNHSRFVTPDFTFPTLLNNLQSEMKRALQKGLLNLPAPKNEYKISVHVPEEEEADVSMEEDATDVLERENRLQREKGIVDKWNNL